MFPGAQYSWSGGVVFHLWAPFSRRVDLKLLRSDRTLAMKAAEEGYFLRDVPDLLPGEEYLFLLDGKLARPDPASHYQPHGVHGPSQVVDHSLFQWEDACWSSPHIGDMVFYEIHAGTFSDEGNFDGIVARLPYLRDLGINALEIMPVSQFPGERNWGYDGVYPWSVQNSYGGPDGLKRLVNRCHAEGIAVFLDVVHNHLGPEGCYLRDFGPYFTDRYKTPWGDALNFDGPGSDAVRDYFIGSALHLLEHYHLDGLRLDAVHAIHDRSAAPYLRELSERIEEFSRRNGRKRWLVSESDLNDSILVRSRDLYGYGHDAQWCDDFHHALHAILANERSGYYADFGSPGHLERSFSEGYVYQGDYSRFRGARHGNSSKEVAPEKFIVFSQNHDQTGNRMMGERLASLVDFESLKLAAGAVLLSPYIPLLFMGEEYGETAPFYYFVSHTDAGLVEAVRQGREREFQDFLKARGEIGKTEILPDAGAGETFLASKLQWGKAQGSSGSLLRNLYRELIRMRRELPALRERSRSSVRVGRSDEILWMERRGGGQRLVLFFNFSGERGRISFPGGQAQWRPLFVSAGTEWDGPSSRPPDILEQGDGILLYPASFALYEAVPRDEESGVSGMAQDG